MLFYILNLSYLNVMSVCKYSTPVLVVLNSTPDNEVGNAFVNCICLLVDYYDLIK